VAPATGTGLSITFRPDPIIFGDARFDPNRIRARFREYAFLNAGICFTFSNRQIQTEDAFEFADGIADLVRWLNIDRQPLHPDMFVTRGEVEGIRYEIGLQWCQNEETLERVYVNDEFLPHGGTAISGMRAGITLAINRFIRNHLPDAKAVKGEHTRMGLTAVGSIRMTDPIFESATRLRLANPEVERILRAAIGKFLRNAFAANPVIAGLIARRTIFDAEAEVKAREARKRKK
jgi:DNA gyrase subunit B